MPEDAGAWAVFGMHLLVVLASAFAFVRVVRLLNEPEDDDWDWGEDDNGGGGGGGGSNRRGPRGPWGGGLPLDRLEPWPRRLRSARPKLTEPALARRASHPPGRRRPARRPTAPRMTRRPAGPVP